VGKIGDPGRPWHRRRWVLVGGVAVALLAVLAGVLAVRLTGGGEKDAAREAADRFAAAWSADHLGRGSYDTSSAAVAKSYTRITEALSAAKPSVRTRSVRLTDTGARAKLAVSWPLAGHAMWRYGTTVRLLHRGDRWLVHWAPSVIHPKLERGERLSLQRTQPPRAPIVDAHGRPLVKPRPVVDVGIYPRHVKDLTKLTHRLGELVHIDAASLATRVHAADPDAFVPVITLRRADYEAIRAEIHPLPGVVFHEGMLPLAPTREFARAVLGTVGPVTEEILKQSHGRYAAGDLAGLSGLQRRYDARLAGTVGVEVDAVRTSNGASHSSGQTDPVRLFRRPPKPGKPVQVSLESSIQEAADQALAHVSERSALVAISVRTGHVLAVANSPDAGGNDLALRGRYAPGSAFKVVTTLALLKQGLDPDQPVACPAHVVVDGKSFHNYEHEVLGTVPFHVDFAKSCNTAFIGLSSRLSAGSLQDAARQLGVGVPAHLGVPAFSGKVPATTSDLDKAAAAFGQGRVQVSPFAMATMAASVAHGAYLPPELVLNPTKPTPSSRSLPNGPTRALRHLMRQVVTDGTATLLANVPGGPVHAKTGTAEYGTASPPKTHAWLVGYQDGIAFAAFVQSGRSGADTAGPIVLRFLRALHAGGP
jgi:cell division protein FtsI/penicillin-binding protein 2